VPSLRTLRDGPGYLCALVGELHTQRALTRAATPIDQQAQLARDISRRVAPGDGRVLQAGIRVTRRRSGKRPPRFAQAEGFQNSVSRLNLVFDTLRLIDELDREISECERELRRLGADLHYVPLLCTVPGISWVLAYTIAAELGDIGRFATPRKLVGYSGLCPGVYQSGERDLRGPLAKQGPRYLRWALVEAATHACTAPVYRERYQQTKARIGKQRGAKVAQIDLARRLSEAIWHMLSRGEPFAPKGATDPLAA
jgi:transposase